MPVREKSCNFCGSKLNVETIDNFIEDTKVDICMECLKTAYYCSICKKIKTKFVMLENYTKVCPDCLTTDTICHYCGKEHKNIKENACPTCFKKMKICLSCNTRHMDTVNTEDGYFCRKCFNPKNYILCGYCNKYVTSKNYNKQTEMCTTCCKNIVSCNICGNKYPKESLQYLADDIYICKKHTITGKSSCSCCGEKTASFVIAIKFGPESNIAEDNLVVCSNCFINKDRIGIIKKYGYKPEGKFKPQFNEYPTLYMGIENEMTFENNVPRILMAGIVANQQDPNEEFYYLKRDGTVPNGFELVTHPMTFEFWKDHFPYDKIFKSLPHTYSNNNNTCGMHIHMSKAGFTNAQLYKFMKFFTDNQKFVQLIAERVANQWCNEVRKETLIEKAKQKSGRDRDQINMRPEHTLEIRIFRGATSEEQWRKNIEFVYGIYSFVKKATINMLTKADFIEYLLANSEDYANLIRFLRKHAELTKAELRI